MTEGKYEKYFFNNPILRGKFCPRLVFFSHRFAPTLGYDSPTVELQSREPAGDFHERGIGASIRHGSGRSGASSGTLGDAVSSLR
jgi:hypothetical protein